MVAPAMRALPVGIPKLIVSTVASGEVSKYVGPSDIMLMPSVADVQGLNAITEEVLANAAQAMIGMVAARQSAKPRTVTKPAIGLTMFGVTTPCVQQVTKQLTATHDCLVFHATGIGGQAMEALVDGGKIVGVLDISTTEVCDLLMGGVFPATEDRFGAIIRTRIPYIGSVGALDMVNFGAPETVPERYAGRHALPAQSADHPDAHDAGRMHAAWDAGSARGSIGWKARSASSCRKAASRRSMRRASPSTTLPPVPLSSLRSSRRCGRRRRAS